MSIELSMSHFFRKYTGVLIILIALGIRLLDGIRVPMYMDEIPLLYNVSHFIGQKTILPEHYGYPTFFSYLMVVPVVAIFIGQYVIAGYPLSGLADSRWMQFLFDHKLSLLVFGGRFVSFCAFAMTIVVVYLWANKRYGWGAGLIAALILALDPFGGIYLAFSRYALPEMTMAFLVTAAMLFCFAFVTSKQKQHLFLASFLAGLAVSTKYNAGMAVIPLLCAPFLFRESRRWKVVLSSWGLLIFGFVVGSPGWIAVPMRFIRGYFAVNNLVTGGHIGDYGTDWLWVFEHIWWCGTYVLPVALFAVGYAVYKHTREDILFLLLIVPSFFYIGQFEKKSMHYFLFLFPILALYMGKTMHQIGQWIGKPFLKKLFVVLCIGLFFLNPLFRISRMVKRDLTLDNRIAAEKWIEKEIPSGSTLLIDPVIFRKLIDTDQANRTIEEIRSSGSPYKKEMTVYFNNRPRYRILNIRDYWDDPDGMYKNDASNIVISSSNYWRFFISDSSRIPDPGSPLYRVYQDQKEFYQTIFSEEGRSLRLVNHFSGIAGPEIRIYQRSIPIQNVTP